MRMSSPALARLLAGCVAIASLIIGPGFDSPWGTRASAQARERVLYVSAYESSTEQPVKELQPDALVVREDGVRREVLRVVPASSPMPVAVLIDNSQAATPVIADLRRALSSFVTALDGIGPVALITVADRPTIATDFTSSQKELLDSVNRLFAVPNSGATLLDTIDEVAKGLSKRESDRAAIVIVTTENTDFSHLQYIDVLKSIRASGASAHAIVLVNPNGSFATDEARNRATVLDRGPRENGGVRMDVLTSMSFESRLKDLAAILKTQHRVVYARPESLIPPEKIEISSAKPGIEARGIPARGQGAK
jgi:hypothetical protein